MRKHRLLSAFSNLLMTGALTLCTGPASAVVNSTQSRLVFNENSEVQSLTVVNSLRAPALVQMWTDDSDPLSPPERISTPLVVVPPLFKLAPAESRTLRVMLLSRKDMPQDRERLYWLNIYQIPPYTRQQTAQEKKVIFPVRIRLKIFIRPTGVKAPDEEIGEQLKFSINKLNTKNSELQVQNPTPYYMNIGSIRLGNETLKSEMIAPFSSRSFALKQTTDSHILSWSVIDDYGTQKSYKRELSSP
ncbi:fimbria/pilus periplasmic chaperone [Pantoea sp. ARC607]|uniref:fimbria/pilus periplasmic chaperone n=1 Tax=unclassified Pantoea TaxID=2630326 RepID=UPI001F3EB984|nr:fimbria/pilus periplasmic chaperone [Pantoea sp. ARC607]